MRQDKIPDLLAWWMGLLGVSLFMFAMLDSFVLIVLNIRNGRWFVGWLIYGGVICFMLGMIIAWANNKYYEKTCGTVLEDKKKDSK